MTKKIMIVDDDPSIVKYLTAVFNDNGYETCSALNGVEALDVFKKNNPDLITLDLDMPQEWGPRFYRKLTKDKEFKKIPVIVISGLSSIKHSIKDAVAFIHKPFNIEKLIAVVRDTIGS